MQSQIKSESSVISTAFANIMNFITRHQDAAAHLLLKHGVNAPASPRNIGLTAKLSPAFFKELKKLSGDNSDSFTGDAERITLADKLANAGIIFSNTIRESQRKPEPYNKQIPSYYEPTGNYNTHIYTDDRPIKSTRFLGMDKTMVWVIGGLIVLALLYEFNKRK